MTASARTIRKDASPAMRTPPVVSPEAWEAARQQLLVKEKANTRARDALAAERRRLPWMAVEATYAFEGPEGRASLLDLFDGRRQLIVYRAFFEPGVFGWPEHACEGCSMVADQVAHVAHLNARDTTLRLRLPCAAGGHRAPEDADGLGDAVVHPHGQLRCRLRCGGVARNERVLPRRRSRVPHLLHQQPRRRADGEHLELPRHHAAGPAGSVGGLAHFLDSPYMWRTTATSGRRART